MDKVHDPIKHSLTSALREAKLLAVLRNASPNIHKWFGRKIKYSSNNDRVTHSSNFEIYFISVDIICQFDVFS